ncbi:hypothetical protein AAY473_017060 [Plecturocebus cupreus]
MQIRVQPHPGKETGMINWDFRGCASTHSTDTSELQLQVLSQGCRRRLISQRSSLETLEDIEENAPLRSPKLCGAACGTEPGRRGAGASQGPQGRRQHGGSWEHVLLWGRPSPWSWLLPYLELHFRAKTHVHGLGLHEEWRAENSQAGLSSFGTRVGESRGGEERPEEDPGGLCVPSWCAVTLCPCRNAPRLVLSLVVAQMSAVRVLVSLNCDFHQLSQTTALNLKSQINQAHGYAPVVPATQEAEARGSLDPRSSRLKRLRQENRLNLEAEVAVNRDCATALQLGRQNSHLWPFCDFLLPAEDQGIWGPSFCREQLGPSLLCAGISPSFLQLGDWLAQEALLLGKEAGGTVETRFHHVDQAGLKLLTSGDPPALAPENARITGPYCFHYHRRLLPALG